MILNDIVLKTHDKLAKGSYLFDIVTIIDSFKEVSSKGDSFFDAVNKEGLSIIAELKKASPQQGVINETFDLKNLIEDCDGVVEALSIPTEEMFFLGHPEYIRVAYKMTNLPILRRDYIISPLQILEAKELGASAVILIATILDKRELQEFIKMVNGLKMDALVEVYNEKDLEKALLCNAKMIAINNLDLVSDTVDLSVTVKMMPHIPKDILVVSESGIKTKEDMDMLKNIGVDGVIIGEVLMKSNNVKKTIELLRKG